MYNGKRGVLRCTWPATLQHALSRCILYCVATCCISLHYMLCCVATLPACRQLLDERTKIAELVSQRMQLKQKLSEELLVRAVHAVAARSGARPDRLSPLQRVAVATCCRCNVLPLQRIARRCNSTVLQRELSFNAHCCNLPQRCTALQRVATLRLQRRDADRLSLRQRAALNIDTPAYWVRPPAPSPCTSTHCACARDRLQVAQSPRPDYVEVELERSSDEFRQRCPMGPAAQRCLHARSQCARV
jgi:hypothetical protein